MSDGTRFSDPGEFNELSCDICGEKMDVTRNVNGPTSFAAAMGEISRLHDSFNCPFREDMWHKQACKLKAEARRNPSKRLADIMMSEMTEVLTTRNATKEVSLL